VAPWSSGNSVFGDDWFEVTNGGATTVDITDWRWMTALTAFRNRFLSTVSPKSRPVSRSSLLRTPIWLQPPLALYSSGSTAILRLDYRSATTMDKASASPRTVIKLTFLTPPALKRLASLSVLPKDHQFYRPSTIRPVSTVPPSRPLVLWV
jgi:hypothetical protein